MKNDFLEAHSWFDEQFKAKSDSRHVTFRIALNLLYQRKQKEVLVTADMDKFPLILETGTVRQAEDYGAGYSTYIFGMYLNKYGGKLITVDIDENNMNVCKEVTKPFEANIEYVVSDSIAYLEKFEGSPDLLYLDSLDTPIEGDATEAQEHNLKEFKLMEDKIHDKTIVLLDDNDFANGGKTRKTKEYLASRGWRLIINSQQSLWIK